MKKTLKLLTLALILCLIILSLTGCGKQEEIVVQEEPEVEEEVIEEDTFDVNSYTKEVENYTLTPVGTEKAIEVGFTKVDGWEADTTKADYRLILDNPTVGGNIEVKVFHTDLSTSKTVAKKEESDFDASTIKDFRKYTINGFEAWEVYRVNSSTGLVMSYETQIFLGEEDGKTTAVQITLGRSTITSDASKTFNREEYVKTDDFQYLLHSIKLK